MRNSVRQKADELGIDYNEIERKASKAEDIAEENGIDLSEVIILPNFDMNGPIVDKETVDYSLNPGVKEAMSFLDEVSEVSLSMLSGWDVNTLQFVAEDRLGIDMDHVGELGSQAVIGDEEFTTVDADYDEILDFRRDMLLEAAADGLTINELGNISPVTGCTYVEGHRKGLFENHPIAQRSQEEFSTERLYREMLEEGVDEDSIAVGDSDVMTKLPERLREDSGDYLAIDLDDDTALEAFSQKLTREYPLTGLKLDYVGGKEIRITPNTEESVEMDDENLLNYFQRLMDEIGPGTVFELDHNPDLSTDYQRTDIEVSKETDMELSKEYGANERGEEVTEEDERFIFLNVGDKPGDVLEGNNAVFFDQEDYPSSEYVEEHGIDSVTVEGAAEYSLITAELIQRHAG